MNKIRIVADDKIPFLRESPLSALCDMTFLPGGRISRADLLSADALITRTRTKCNAETLDGTRVKLIATATIGYDHIDTEYCARNGIVWKNAPGCNAPSVAQYLTSLLLSFSQKYSMELRGKVIGVIGAGNVGKRVIEAASALGMRVLVNDPPRQEAEGSDGFVSLEEICRNADFLSFHVPLEREGQYPTFHLADHAFLSSLKPGAIVINTSRGEVVDNRSLKGVLSEKRIRGAALDVWEGEPEIDLELMKLLDFATPHIAGYSTDGKANGTAASVRTAARFFGWKEAESWYPSVPLPEKQELEVASLADAVYASYDIRKDDAALRKSPAEFEKQRGNYPLRREFQAYRIRNMAALAPELQATLRRLKFQE